MNLWRSLRGLPKGLWVLFAATLINRAGTMVLPFLALHLTLRGDARAHRAAPRKTPAAD